MSRPRVSVVLATHDASHLLRYALQSLLLGEWTDWEAIVVGDACTDDTEAVVLGFGDDRIRFRNLEQNSGQQAAPTNVALGLVRGDFVAFLNQDDLYLEHHLATNLERMRSGSAGWICCPYAEIPPEQLERVDRGEIVARVRGFAPSGRFDPRRFHVASSWFIRREVVERVGPWRVERRTWVTPSQDWLFRAYRMGIPIACPQTISLIAIYSGERPGFLRRRDSPEHDFVFREIVAGRNLRPAFDRVVAASIAEKRAGGGARRAARADPLAVHGMRRTARRRGLRRALRKLERGMESVLMRCGVHPKALRMMLRYGSRGGYVREITRRTGAFARSSRGPSSSEDARDRGPSPRPRSDVHDEVRF
ncbi:MAG: glycosyltransferase family 2 protein [bacterium]